MMQPTLLPNSPLHAHPSATNRQDEPTVAISNIRPSQAAGLSTLILAIFYLANIRVFAQDSIETVDFGTIHGQVALRDAESITLKNDSGEQVFAFEDVIRIDLAERQPPPARPRTAILMSTADVLLGTIAGSDQHHIVVLSPTLGQVLAPIRWVAVILFAEVPPGTAEALQQAAQEKDVALLQNGERLEGIVAKFSPEHIRFRTAPGELEIPIARVAGVAMCHTQEPPPADGLRVCVSTIDGSVLTGRIQPLQEAGRFALETPWATLPVSVHESVRSIEIRGGRIVYLSDISPVEVEQVPYLGRLWPWRADRSVGGTPLSIRGKVYRKGLGVHSRCRLAYNLGGQFRRFRAEIGIDDATAHIGQATFSVLIDGHPTFTRENLDGTHQPVQVDLDTTGAQTLVLVVDYGMGLDVGDHANWADARLEKVREN